MDIIGAEESYLSAIAIGTQFITSLLHTVYCSHQNLYEHNQNFKSAKIVKSTPSGHTEWSEGCFLVVPQITTSYILVVQTTTMVVGKMMKNNKVK